MSTRKRASKKLGRWKRQPGMPGVQAPLSHAGHYTISHRSDEHTVSYRPPGEHHHVGTFPKASLAKQAAHRHHAAGALTKTGYHLATNQAMDEVVEHPGSKFACRLCEDQERRSRSAGWQGIPGVGR